MLIILMAGKLKSQQDRNELFRVHAVFVMKHEVPDC